MIDSPYPPFLRYLSAIYHNDLSINHKGHRWRGEKTFFDLCVLCG